MPLASSNVAISVVIVGSSALSLATACSRAEMIASVAWAPGFCFAIASMAPSFSPAAQHVSPVPFLPQLPLTANTRHMDRSIRSP